MDLSTQIPPSSTPKPTSNVSSGGEEGGEPVYCGKCGTQNSTGSDFCVNCGIKLHPALVEVSTETAPSTSPTVKGKSAWNRTKYLAVFIILILIVATLFGSGVIQRMVSPMSPPPSQYTGSSSSVTPTAVTSGVRTSSSSTRTSFSSTAPPIDIRSIPSPPLVVGCYQYVGGKWGTVPCLSQESVRKFGQFPDAYLGIGQSTSPSVTPLTFGYVQVAFKDYHGETDSQDGDKAYSIQLNTNDFASIGHQGDQGWVQFVYQDFCGYGYQFIGEQSCASNSRFCIWNVDITVAGQTNNNQGYNPTCVSPGPVDLSSGYYADIIGYTAPGQKLVSIVGLPGVGPLSVVAPDTYGLAYGTNWSQVAGQVYGAGGGSEAKFGSNPTLEQTNIMAESCPTPSGLGIFDDCTSPPITAASQSEPSTAESNDLNLAGSSLTSYNGGSHWWLSTAYCVPNNRPDCTPFINYDSDYYWQHEMLFSVAVNPGSGSTYAGGANTQGGYGFGAYVTPTVTVTSVNGVNSAPLTMSVGGLNSQVGTEDLSGKTCTFSLPLQPGSTCTFNLDIVTNPAAKAATYPLTISAKTPSEGQASAPYALTILPSAAPSPVIVSPPNGASANQYQAVLLIGFAPNTLAGQLGGGGYIPCDQMQFQATGPGAGPGGSPKTATPTPDPQYSGYCDAQMTFTVLGTVSITLTAKNVQENTVGKSQAVTITIVSSQTTQTNIIGTHTTTVTTARPFTFTLTAPSSSVITEGGSPDKITISIITTGGSPQPVKLDVSGLPAHATYSLSSNSPTPTTTVTLTITAPFGTAPGTYTVKITGTPSGGGTPQTVTIQLTVEAIG